MSSTKASQSLLSDFQNSSVDAKMTTADADPLRKPKKKKSTKKPQLNGIDTISNSHSNDPKTPNGKIPPSPAMSSTSSKSKDSSAGSLIICRNKHWRYISSFHGPWLQLPPEVLESLAYHNWGTPRPHPIDPAVFFDIVKIRRLVDEATTISVRAASGVASSSSSYNSSAASLMGGGNAAILGIGFTNPNSNAKLSRERKHRMRELATQKLCKAYALDEIAASVATMQGASTLEDVASFVLQRNPNDVDAKYVHFFHEKIPSRMLAASTSLDPLDQVIFDRPYDGWALRTRAVTKGFKEDHAGAAADLTSALKKVRTVMHDAEVGLGGVINEFLSGEMSPGGGHSSGNLLQGNRGSRGTGSGSGGGPGSGIWDGATKDEAIQPSSLEMQLVFHRASTYLTIACQKIETYNALIEPQKGTGLNGNANGVTNGSMRDTTSSGESSALLAKRETIRKAIRANSKKAIRDYLKYLSYFDYTPGLTPEEAEEQLRESIKAATRIKNQKQLEFETSGASRDANGKESSNGTYTRARIPAPRGPVYPVSTLFTTPPSTLPPYPPLQTQEMTKFGSQPSPSLQPSLTPVYEQVTYHPLFTDALHSLLLCHSIISTPAKEIQRYAFMVARLARICDGYPIFLAARSPARADWIELIRRVGDWMNLGRSWESLCQPAPLPPVFDREDGPHGGHGHGHGGSAGGGLIGNDINSDALTALMGGADDALDVSEIGGNGAGHRDHNQMRGAKRWAQEDGKEYPISTERAAIIARFVKEEIKRAKDLEKTKSNPENGNFAAVSSTSNGKAAEKVTLPMRKEESFEADELD